MTNAGQKAKDYTQIAWAAVEGGAQGVKNEVIGAGKFLYSGTVGLGEQIALTGEDIAEANYGGTDFQSALFQGVFNMSLQGSTTREMVVEAASN